MSRLAVPSPEIAVRPAVEADLVACAEIYEVGQRQIHPEAALGAWARSGFRDAVPGEEILVATAGEGGAVVGFVSLWRPDAFVHFLHVRPGWQRRGVGRLLLRRAVDALEGPVELKCAPGNAGALAFYDRLGWVEVERELGGPAPFVRLRLAR